MFGANMYKEAILCLAANILARLHPIEWATTITSSASADRIEKASSICRAQSFQHIDSKESNESFPHPTRRGTRYMASGGNNLSNGSKSLGKRAKPVIKSIARLCVFGRDILERVWTYANDSLSVVKSLECCAKVSFFLLFIIYEIVVQADNPPKVTIMHDGLRK
jgi:hypothetical protein